MNVVKKNHPLKLEAKAFEDEMCLLGDKIEMEFGNRFCRRREDPKCNTSTFIDYMYLVKYI